MHVITRVDEIRQGTPEGRLAMALLARITVAEDCDLTPDQSIAKTNVVLNQMFTPMSDGKRSDFPCRGCMYEPKPSRREDIIRKED